MKSIILGAFIVSLFFAVAQSTSLSRYHHPDRVKGKEVSVPNAAADTSSAYVLGQAPGYRP